MFTCITCGNSYNSFAKKSGNANSDKNVYICNSCFMLNELSWDRFKFFAREEKWGKPEFMNIVLLWHLETLRLMLKKPFIIHCGFATKGHAANSYHYQGAAVDFHINEYTYADLLFINKNWSGGVGFYPDWNNPGIHLDIGLERRWIMRNGEYMYFDKDNIIPTLREYMYDGK